MHCPRSPTFGLQYNTYQLILMKNSFREILTHETDLKSFAQLTISRIFNIIIPKLLVRQL